MQNLLNAHSTKQPRITHARDNTKPVTPHITHEDGSTTVSHECTLVVRRQDVFLPHWELEFL